MCSQGVPVETSEIYPMRRRVPLMMSMAGGDPKTWILCKSNISIQRNCQSGCDDRQTIWRVRCAEDERILIVLEGKLFNETRSQRTAVRHKKIGFIVNSLDKTRTHIVPWRQRAYTLQCTQSTRSFPWVKKRDVTWTNATFLDSRHINRIRWAPTPSSSAVTFHLFLLLLMEIFRTLVGDKIKVDACGWTKIEPFVSERKSIGLIDTHLCFQCECTSCLDSLWGAFAFLTTSHLHSPSVHNGGGYIFSWKNIVLLGCVVICFHSTCVSCMWIHRPFLY